MVFVVSIALRCGLVALVQVVCVVAMIQPGMAGGREDCRQAGMGRAWLPAEYWSWSRICAGERADLSAFKGSPVIRSSFVAEIVTDRELDAVLPYEGTAIAHARFAGPLHLAHHSIDKPLALEYSEFKDTLDLSRLATSTNLSLQGSRGGIIDLRYLRAGDVWLQGAHFTEIDLSDASIGGWLFASGARVAVRLDLEDVAIDKSLDLDRSVIGDLRLAGAQIGSILSIKGATVGGNVDMSEASVGRQAEFDNSSFAKENTLVDLRVSAHLRLPRSAGDIDLSGSQIDGDLLVLGSHVRELKLARAHVGGQVSIADSTISNLQASGLTLAKDLSMVHSGIGDQAVLSNDEVGGSVVFDHVSFPARGLGLTHLNIAGNLNIFNDLAPGSTVFSNLTIGGDLALSGGKLTTLDFTGSKIAGDLLLGQPEPIEWQSDTQTDQGSEPQLVLHNVSVRAIEDRNRRCKADDGACDLWPPRLDLTGLTFEHFGSASAALFAKPAGGLKPDDPLERSEAWWRDHWLKKQQPFSPEPYDELSSVLRRLGRDDVADKIMYDLHDETTRAQWARNPLLLMQKAVIGYGYDVWLAFPWALGFVALGVIVLRLSGEGKRLGLPYGVTYSFDMLLPVVRLRESNYQLEPRGFVQYYFYLHKVAGFVLASFLVAALSGLTKQ